MKTHQRQGFTYCWTLILLLLVFFHEVVVGQPQVYFKASLPAKSLPRIGRRSDPDIFPANNEGWNEMLNLNNNNYIPRPESVLLWKKIMGENLYPDESQLSLGPNLYKFKSDK